MRQSKYQRNPHSPSDRSFSPQSHSTHDQFDATNVARADDPLLCLTPPPTSLFASGPGSHQEIPAQYGAQPDPYASLNHFAGVAPPAAPASQQLFGGSKGIMPMPVSSTANSCNANLTAFGFNSQSPEFYGDAHLFHLSNHVIPAYAGCITTSHSARQTRDAQYTDCALGATQNAANINNCFSSFEARDLPLDNSSAGSLVG